MSLFISIKKTLGDFTLDAQLDINGIHGLFGASGAGKSTLLACVAGVLTPASGEIILNGETFFSKALKINLPPQVRRTAYAMQAPTLFANMNVSENIKIAICNKHEKEEKTQSLLKLLQIEKQAKQYPCALSLGQMQRVTLARAVAAGPKVLLLDEPFSALDLPLKTELEAVIISLQRRLEIPIIYVSHDLCELSAICNDISIIENGKIVNDKQKLNWHAKQIISRHEATLSRY